MSNILVILFAVLDCKAWSIDQVRSWADRLIAIAVHPKTWLIDLSTGGSVDDCSEIVRNAMREFGIVLPSNAGDLMAGLVLLRFDNAGLAAESARQQLVDVVDAYGTSCVDAEAAERLDLMSSNYSEIRAAAEQALRYLNGGQFCESDRRLIEE